MCVCVLSNSYGFLSIIHNIYTIPVAVKRAKTCFYVFVCIVVVRSDVLPQPSDETVLDKAKLI